jgi:hypothetical protein
VQQIQDRVLLQLPNRLLRKLERYVLLKSRLHQLRDDQVRPSTHFSQVFVQEEDYLFQINVQNQDTEVRILILQDSFQDNFSQEYNHLHFYNMLKFLK